MLAGGHPHVPEPPRAAGHGDLQRPARHQAAPRPRQPRAQAGQEDASQDEVAAYLTVSILYLLYVSTISRWTLFCIAVWFLTVCIVLVGTMLSYTSEYQVK